MQDKHVASDGFKYEAGALRGLLDGGHDTSLMTNLKLKGNNLALCSAIFQEWLQQHSTYSEFPLTYLAIHINIAIDDLLFHLLYSFLDLRVFGHKETYVPTYQSSLSLLLFCDMCLH